MRRNDRLAALERSGTPEFGERFVHYPQLGDDHALIWMSERANNRVPMVVSWPGMDEPEDDAARAAFFAAGRELGYLNDAHELIR